MKVVCSCMLGLVLQLSAAVSSKADLELLRQKAKAGSGRAQLELGNAYFSGVEGVVTKDPVLAVTWYKKAAERGNPSAFFNLGLIYDLGYGVKQDYRMALFYYEKAVELKVEMAMLNAGVIYRMNGDVDKARSYFKRVAEAGEVRGMRLYGELLLEDKRYTEAFRYLRNAALKGDGDAMASLADCYYYGRGTVKSLEQAILCLEKAVKLKSVKAYVRLAFFYASGKGVERRVDYAIELYHKAGLSGNDTAMVEYGRLLIEHSLNKTDYRRAFNSFVSAATLGNVNGMYNAGVCLSMGKGTPMNRKQAFLYFEGAAKAGHTKAQYNTGLCFEEGQGIKASPTMAFYWYKKAAESGDAEAMVSLAECYYFGKGAYKSIEKAKVYLLKAKEKGSEDAVNLLAELYDVE